MPHVPGIGGFIGQMAGGTVPPPPYSVEYAGSAEDGNNRTTYTFAGMDFGPEHALRHILVAVSGQCGSNPGTPTCTVAGVAATLLYDRANGAAGALWSFFRVALPTGLTGTVVINWGAACAVQAISVFRMINPPRLTAYGTSAVGSSATKSVNVPAGGYIIGSAYNSATGAHTWPAAVPEVYDSIVGTNTRSSFGLGFFSAAVTPQSVTVSGAGALGLISI